MNISYPDLGSPTREFSNDPKLIGSSGPDIPPWLKPRICFPVVPVEAQHLGLNHNAMIQHFDVDASLQCMGSCYVIWYYMESKHRQNMKSRMFQRLLWRELWQKNKAWRDSPIFLVSCYCFRCGCWLLPLKRPSQRTGNLSVESAKECCSFSKQAMKPVITRHDSHHNILPR